MAFPAAFHDDEDINSLVVRMAENGCMTSQEFVRHYLLSGIVSFNEGTYPTSALRRLAILAGVDEDAIQRNAVTCDSPVQNFSLENGAQFRGAPLFGGHVRALTHIR
ncbi:hypothetical protein [Devosia psychrophila]|nr:hypothetical protein [Devosia psychrophila]